jgi:hypothetical protein
MLNHRSRPSAPLPSRLRMKSCDINNGYRASRVGGDRKVPLPSSNRRCRFPTSGSPESSRLRHALVPISVPAWPFGPASVSVEKPSPAVPAPSPFPASPFLRLPEFP